LKWAGALEHWIVYLKHSNAPKFLFSQQ